MWTSINTSKYVNIIFLLIMVFLLTPCLLSWYYIPAFTHFVWILFVFFSFSPLFRRTNLWYKYDWFTFFIILLTLSFASTTFCRQYFSPLLNVLPSRLERERQVFSSIACREPAKIAKKPKQRTSKAKRIVTKFTPPPLRIRKRNVSVHLSCGFHWLVPTLLFSNDAFPA